MGDGGMADANTIRAALNAVQTARNCLAENKIVVAADLPTEAIKLLAALIAETAAKTAA
jgi:hypothetical protein